MIPLLQNKLVQDVYDLHSAKREGEPPRNYLGGSSIGRECSRQLWYGFRKVRPADFSGRILRLFETGHREEDRMVSELQEAGYTVMPVNPATQEQWEVEAFGGHVKGHFDGLVKGIPDAPSQWHLLETKTSNKKGFKKLAYWKCSCGRRIIPNDDGTCPRCDGDDLDHPRGVQSAKPIHYAQMQVYMGLAKEKWEEWGLDGDPPKAALYLVHCKDDERLYAERVYFDPGRFRELGLKAKSIIEATEPPPREWHDPDYYKCRWCDFQGICWGTEIPRVDCRTCAHSTPYTDGRGWVCERHGSIGSEMADACPDHLYIPPLLERVAGGVVDYGRPGEGGYDIDWIEYGDGEGVRLRNVTVSMGGEGMTSHEIREAEWSLVDSGQGHGEAA